jgi:hypothetical protein
LASEQGREVVGWVTELVERQYRVSPGSPTERDGKDDSGLTNDFTFDTADPPFAVEITRLRNDYENLPWKDGLAWSSDFVAPLQRSSGHTGPLESDQRPSSDRTWSPPFSG